MTLSPDLLGAILAFSAALFLAVGILFIRKTTVVDSPLHGVLATATVGLMLYLPLSAIFYYPFDGLSLQSLGLFAFSGALGLVLARTFYYKGAKKIGATWTAPIKNASLTVSSIIGIFFLSERVTLGHLAGIFLIAMGVIILGRETTSDENKSDLNIESNFDLLIPLGSMFLFGIADPLVKVGLSGGTPILIGLMVMHLSATALVTGFFLWHGKSILYPFRSDLKYQYLGAGLSLSVGVFLIFLALKISPLVIVIPLKSTSPLFVLIISYVFLKDLERITKVLVLGTVAIVLGAILIGSFM